LISFLIPCRYWGLIDDASVIICVARANLTLISNFRKWEILFDRDLSPSMNIPQWNNPRIMIGDRLRALREEKNLSQGDIEKRTGLFRSYISRVEHGHTVPTIETLEKMARAFEIPMYQLFTTVTGRPSYRIFPSGSRLTKMLGAAPAKMRDF
jgi:DNA-binding XRE family transcriptional regulator